MNSKYTNNFNQLALKIKQLGKEFGFSKIGITDTNLLQETTYFEKWLKSGYHGNMHYFEKHSNIYTQPEKLLPNTTRIICCRINYPKSPSPNHPIAAFAKTQDYSVYIRRLLKEYVNKIIHNIQILQKTRIFSGNAPILEKALAAKAGLGWYGKNSVLLSEDSGSFFFLGEILIDTPLPIDKPIPNRCGNCSKCIDSCPTQALVSPYQLDTRRCIAYLTIEHKGVIPEELRPLIGTKIFGCDRCQEVCPWNQDLHISPNTSFTLSTNLTTENLVEWFLWDEEEFKNKTKDYPINRISHECWLRNIAVALGNSLGNSEILKALRSRLNYPSSLVREHVEWAITNLVGS